MMSVHPFADRFPMMSDVELADLADDIRLYGLLHPIMLDQSGEQLIDGRNRLRACEIAGVAPTFERLHPDIDPIAFILSNNVNRRHLNKGQQAILKAWAYPNPEPGKRNDLNGTSVETTQVNTAVLAQARVIVKWRPDLVEDILSGAQVFSKAFEEAAILR